MNNFLLFFMHAQIICCSPTSENDVSSANTRYSNKLETVKVTRHQPPNISKDNI